MNRKSKFLIGFAAAALTFGTLMATVGPKHFNHHGSSCYHNENCYKHNDSVKESDPSNAEKGTTQPITNQQSK